MTEPTAISNTDPIIPGTSAGGLRIGASEETLPTEPVPTNKVANEYGSKRYYYDGVIVVISFGYILAIILEGSYGGKFLDRVGIGSRWADIVAGFGPLVELECDDVFVLPDYPGIEFEFDSPIDSRLTHIIVKK